jgi:xanthine dehydrogenase/oxidase
VNNPDARIVVGNTEVGIEVKFRNMVSKDVVSTACVPELLVLETDHQVLKVGASVTLSKLQAHCATLKESSNVAAAIYNQLRWFASTQIRNAACLGGNIATASPISDMNPILTAVDATLEISSLPAGAGAVTTRMVKVRDFWLGYRKIAMEPNEVIQAVHIPLTYGGPSKATANDATTLEFFEAYKQARRREDDISIVTGGVGAALVKQSNGDYLVRSLSMAVGGMAPTTKFCGSVAAFLEGKVWNSATLEGAMAVLKDELKLPKGVPGGQPEFRMSLCLSFLHKFFLTTCKRTGVAVPEADLSGADSFLTATKPSVHGTQSFVHASKSAALPAEGLEARSDLAGLAMPPKPHPSGETPIGRPKTHLSGALHVSGEAIYVDDMPTPDNLLHGELVLSTAASAYVTSLDTSGAMKVPGVVRVFTAADVDALGGDNALGPIAHDEEVFARSQVNQISEGPQKHTSTYERQSPQKLT